MNYLSYQELKNYKDSIIDSIRIKWQNDETLRDIYEGINTIGHLIMSAKFQGSFQERYAVLNTGHSELMELYQQFYKE